MLMIPDIPSFRTLFLTTTLNYRRNEPKIKSGFIDLSPDRDVPKELSLILEKTKSIDLNRLKCLELKESSAIHPKGRLF